MLARPAAAPRRSLLPTVTLPSRPSRWLVAVGVTGWALVVRRVVELALH